MAANPPAGVQFEPGTAILVRNQFVGLPIHRVDARLQRRFGLGGRRGVDGILEVYNLFNHANYGSYTLAESNASYGKPIQNVGIAYQARMVQLGFRIVFYRLIMPWASSAPTAFSIVGRFEPVLDQQVGLDRLRYLILVG